MLLRLVNSLFLIKCLVFKTPHHWNAFPKFSFTSSWESSREVEISPTMTAKLSPSSLSELCEKLEHCCACKEQNRIELVTRHFPSLSDLSTVNHDADVNFKSLTAQKLMAGLSFNSIDTLLEVNAAAEARTKLNESTETIPTHSVDFGVIWFHSSLHTMTNFEHR